MEINSRLTLETFQRNLNSTFRAYPKEGSPVDLLLVSAQHIRRDALQDIFSVSFRGPVEGALEQGTYPIDHARMGAFQLFIVPYRKGHDFVLYEATFNLLLRPLRID